jgi:threonine dehydrogenase-like Zn-dependent dehydrogenase
MCRTGLFLERGICGRHGYMAEYYAESPHFLVKIPRHQISFAVLLEPMSIVEKAVQQVFKIQERMSWQPQKALVLGAGPIGLLATLLLRSLGVETWTVATRSKESLKARIVEACGARYLNIKEVSFDGGPERKFDVIIEATGNSELAFGVIPSLDINGVLCLTSITGGQTTSMIPVDKINLDVVLGNKVVFGTVNANRRYFQQGVESFDKIESQWPGLLRRMITKEVPVDRFHEALTREHENIKTVMTYDS